MNDYLYNEEYQEAHQEMMRLEELETIKRNEINDMLEELYNEQYDSWEHELKNCLF